MFFESKRDAVVQTAQALPAVAALVRDALSATPERWLTRFGIAFLLLQAAYLIWRWRRDIRRDQRDQAPHDE